MNMDNIPLLKSIENKDPSLNWNIDVSAELEKYLSAIELLDEDINYSQNSEVGNYYNGDGNQNYFQLFNFVEAALIIQNSTSLYSKKIEHLHTLVFETFQLLSTGKSSNDVNVENEDQTNVQNSSKTNAYDKNNEFLMSDIVSVPIELLQPGKNINISSEQIKVDYLKDEILLKYSSCSSYVGVSNAGSSISLSQYRIDENLNVLFLDESDLSRFANIYIEDQDISLNNIFTDDLENSTMNQVEDSEFIDNLEFETYDDNDIKDNQDVSDKLESSDFSIIEKEDENNVNLTNTQHNNNRKKKENDYWIFMDEHLKLGKDKPLKVGRTCKNPLKSYAYSLEDLSQTNDMIDFIDIHNIRSYLMGLTEVEGKKYDFKNQHIPYYSDLKCPKLNIEKFFTSKNSNNFLRSLESDFNACTTHWRKYHSKILFSKIEKNKTEDISENFENLNLECDFDYDQIDRDEIQNETDIVLESIDDIPNENIDITLDNEDLFVEKQIEINDDNQLSELHARINLWIGQVEPLIEIQNSRPQFNVHDESRKIIEKIREKEVNSENLINFEHITYGLPRWQVCRSFLATLMLSNNSEIDIIQNDENESKFFIRLSNNDNDLLNKFERDNVKIDYPKKKKKKELNDDQKFQNNEKIQKNTRKRDHEIT